MGNHQIIITFFLFLLFSGALELVTSSSCAPSSCGALRNITYPFRLSDEPRKCGEVELNCDGKNATIDIQGTKYFVEEILESTEDNVEISVSYAGFANGSRRLSNTYVGYAQQQQQRRRWVRAFPLRLANTFVSLMKCSQKIDITGNEDDHYVSLPSFNSNSSSNSHNTTVYAKIIAVHSYGCFRLYREIEDLRESCSPLGWFCANATSPIHSEHDLLQAALNRIPVSLYFQRSYSGGKEIVGLCLKSTMEDFLYGRKSFAGVIFFPLWFLMDVSDCIELVCEGRTAGKICNRTFDVFLTALRYITTAIMVLAIKRFICLPLVFYVLAIYNLWKARRRRRIDNVEIFLRSQQRNSPTRYAYSDLIAMTNNFTQKLGQGGFGSVFKGHLQGVIPVAVKVLGASKLNGEEFISEVSTIGRIHHLNVVRLLGFCSEGSKRALIYEYMPNGSLDKYIFATKGSDNNNNRHATLTLEKRNEIALGVARGIHYLHHGCEMQILHFDIKPHNILLDSHLNPKVSDFGLAKLYPKDYNSVSVSAARGTIGYMAPELISRSFGVISYKSDVYSFGMLLMEMAGQRRNVDHDVSQSNQIYYPSWIYDKLVQLQVDTSVPDITTEVDEMEAKLCKVGLWCIQMKPSNRPSMSKVVSMLQGGSDAAEVEMPPKPFFSSTEPGSVTRPSFPLISSPDLSIISEHDDLP